MLEHLRYRMEVSIEFPHEIGIFRLPLKDVKCFISYRGGGYRMCGEWKVYHDVVNAQRSFLCYKACREFCQTQLMLEKHLVHWSQERPRRYKMIGVILVRYR